MTGKRFSLWAALVSVTMLAGGCATTSAVVDGVGGVFIGAGEDIRSVSGR